MPVGQHSNIPLTFPFLGVYHFQGTYNINWLNIDGPIPVVPEIIWPLSVEVDVLKIFTRLLFSSVSSVLLVCVFLAEVASEGGGYGDSNEDGHREDKGFAFPPYSLGPVVECMDSSFFRVIVGWAFDPSGSRTLNSIPSCCEELYRGSGSR